MAEYINRDTFLEQERQWYCSNCDKRKNSKGKFVYEVGEAPCRACYVNDLLDEVENCPAADVVARKTGEWKDGGKSAFFPEQGIYCCSECDRHYFTKFRFCPHCGAQMIGGDEDV